MENAQNTSKVYGYRLELVCFLNFYADPSRGLGKCNQTFSVFLMLIWYS
ncbi:hypothetical protein Cflav_PD2990 [Pedosphaera parvula Ellin514]|uniref:Uncharacterized protein n=1 Tax=Pedosphaera parvula (strain Ellin514) TaxID=320771 RepID=B9XIN1_PEDPL|nr:hypothetical protein Cflav_PD2990 [Pedosphaera parvula Ellin514]